MAVKNRSVPTEVGVGITVKGVQPGRIPWWAPFLMLVARPIFALVTQLAVAAGFRLSRHPKPLQEAGRWWMVSDPDRSPESGDAQLADKAGGHAPDGCAQCAA